MQRVTGIDIGSESLKVATVAWRKNRLELLGAGMASLAEIDRGDADFVPAAARALQRVLKRNGIPLGEAVVGLAGRGSMVRYLGVPMVPPWKLALLMGFEVEEQMGNATAGEVAYDYRILSLPEFEEGQFPVFLALAQAAVVEERMAICRAAGRRADDVGLLGVGAFNLYRRSPQCRDEATTILLDIGAEETHLTLSRGGQLWFARTISSGGRRFTQRIQEAMEVLPLEAEELKRQNTQVIRRQDQEAFSEDARRLSETCRTEVGSLASAVESSLHFFRGQLRIHGVRPDRLVLTGGGARLKGLAEALGERLRCEGEVLEIAEAIRPASRSAEAALTAEEAHHFAGAIGMAAGRLTPGGFFVSLLPPQERERRDFWSRRVFVAYAAVFAVLLLLFGFLGAWRSHAAAGERNRAWKAHLKEAKASHEALAVLQTENRRLADRVEALAARVHSGRDLLTCLRRLQEHTPKDIFFTHLVTGDDFTKSETEEDPRRRRGEAADPAAEGNASFQDARHLLLEGFVTAPGRPLDAVAKENRDPADRAALTEQEAVRRLVALADTLQGLPFFRRARILEQAAVPTDAEALEAAYHERIFGEIGAGRAAWAPPAEGVALRFVMRCDIQ